MVAAIYIKKKSRRINRTFLFLSVFLLAPSLLTAQNPSITVNAENTIKPVQVKFGTGVGSMHRGPGWPPVDLAEPALLTLFNEVKPAFINLSYTMSPNSVEHVIGLPFYPESTGEFSQRLSYIEIIEKMGINSSSTGANGDLYALFTSTDTLPELPVIINGVNYYTYKELNSRPPHKNYDDLLQFFEKLDSPPEIFIRVPTVFMTYIDDPFPHTGNTRAEISVDLDPQSGADLVHYLNDPATTTLGKLRSDNGHPEPYNVKYFMLGNEIWWPHVDYGLSIERVVSQTNAFAQAMKTADPTINIVFNPANDAFPESLLRTSDPYYGPIIQKLKNFNNVVIPQIKDHIDAIEFFQYGLAVGDGTELPPLDTEGWKLSMGLTNVNDQYNNAAMHRNIAEQFGANTPMIMGEFSGPSARLGGAIYDVDYMIYLINNNYDVFVANWNAGLIEPNYYGLIKQDIFNASPPVRRPNFYALKMFTNYFGDEIIESVITNSPTFDTKLLDTQEFLVYPATQGISVLNCIATTKNDKLYLMVINKDLDSDTQTDIALSGFTPAGNAQVYTLNGPSVDATNENAAETVKITESTINNVSSSFSYPFEKHSVTVMVFNGTITSVEQPANQLKNQYGILGNYPNPFSTNTTIEYKLSSQAHVKLRIYDIFGREIITLTDEKKMPGQHSIVWHGQDSFGNAVSGSIYFLQISIGDFVQTKRLMVIK